MSLILSYLLTFLLVIVSILIFKRVDKRPKIKMGKPIPPLPRGFWGTVRYLMKKRGTLWDIFVEMRQHGKLHRLDVNWPSKIRGIYISDYELAKQLFSSPIFSARPNNEMWQYYAKGNYGIATSSGKVWEEQRRYNVRKLKDAGLGNKSMEGLIALEVEEFIQTLNELKGKVISPNKLTTIPIINTLWVILSGQRFKSGHSEDSRMIHEANEGFMRCFQLPQIFPITTENQSIFNYKFLITIMKWLPFSSGMRRVLMGFDNLRIFCTKFIAERQKALKAGQHSGSYIDAYLDEINSTTNPQSTFYKDQGVMNLKATITDLILGGGDTTASALLWAIVHLIRNPEIQIKIQAHLDRVVGRDRRPTLSNIPDLPYIMAFLLELLRVTPVSVTSLPHRVTEDTVVEGYFMKKNTSIVVSMAAIHTDPKIWGDPENFRPERFLSENGEKVVQNDAMIAFSIGKRQCPARRLAMDNLFLFVSAMCQKFNLKQDPNLKGIPPIETTGSLFLSPKEFFVLIEDRD